MTRLRWPRKRRTLLIFLLALALLALLAGRALASLNKTLLAMAEARARQLVTAELNEALRYVIDASMSDADLVSVTLDERGRVNMLSANAILMDRLAAEAVAHAQARLRETGDQGVLIPLGSALGGVFSGAGPRVRFSIVPVGAVTAGFVTEFESAGINQTRHTISLEAEATVRIVAPRGAAPISVQARMPVAESVLVGDVPESYIEVPEVSDGLNFLP